MNWVLLLLLCYEASPLPSFFLSSPPPTPNPHHAHQLLQQPVYRYHHHGNAVILTPVVTGPVIGSLKKKQTKNCRLISPRIEHPDRAARRLQVEP